MELALDGRIYAKWTLKSDVPLVDPPEVQVFSGADTVTTATWHVTEWVAPATTDDQGRSVRVCRLLVYGPDAPTGGGLAISAGEHRCRVRVDPSPENIPFEADPITVG